MYKFTGEKYNSNLTMKDISKIVKAELKKTFPFCKWSVTKDYNSLTVSLISAPFPALSDKASEYEKERQYCQVNHFCIGDNERITPFAAIALKKATKIATAYNFDDSDTMTDYFHTNFYLNIAIGKWNKPFTESEAAQ